MKVVVVAGLLWLLAAPAGATTYYVRTDGSNSNAGTANTAGGAWLTIAKGCQTAAAGDTVRVQAGTYVETASGCVSGTSGNTVTLVADGTVTTCGISFTSKSYIRVVGFTFDSSTGGCSRGTAVTLANTNTGIELWNNTAANNSGNVLITTGVTSRCDKCILVGNAVNNTAGQDATAFVLHGDDNLMAYNSVSSIDYLGLGLAGVRNRILNFNVSGLIETTGHPDNMFSYPSGSPEFGFSNVVMEAWYITGSPSAPNNKLFHHNNSALGTQTWVDNIFRRFAVWHIGAGSYSLWSDSGDNLRNRIYHNTLVQTQRAASTASNCAGMGAAHTTSYYVYNDLYQECWGTSPSGSLTVWNGLNPIAADYNLGFDSTATRTFTTPWTSQANPRTNVDPKLHDVTNQDLHLDAGSGAIAQGGPLTTTSGSGSSSTTLTLATNGGGFFTGSNASNLAQYGGNLVPGDFITVGSMSVQISSISGDVLTLATAISWSNGDPVYYDTSATPDIGAYPRKAGGYALSATYTISGGTATITPNDSTLVRFVVCYDSTVPLSVVNASPYTCSTGSGTFSARVYPRYASQTLWDNATAAGSGGRLRLRINIRPGEDD